MGLFSRRAPEPVVHPMVKRSILVPAPLDHVVTQLGEFSRLHSQKHATVHTLQVGVAGPWTVIELPTGLHPSTFHNLGFWLLDTPGGGDGAVLRSGPAPTHPGYELVRDPEIGDCLCGVDDDGVGWTVFVPTNDIVRGEPAPDRSVVSALAPISTSTPIEVLMEDPGAALNPTNAGTRASRRLLSTGRTFPS